MLLWLEGLISTALIVLSGCKPSRQGDIIAEKSGMGRTWDRRGAYGLCVAGIFCRPLFFAADRGLATVRTHASPDERITPHERDLGRFLPRHPHFIFSTRYLRPGLETIKDALEV